jgi:hypothetical protein
VAQQGGGLRPPPAWVRFSVRPRGLIRSWVRGFVRSSSARRAAQCNGGKVTQARDLTSKLANDDRDEDREGVYGFESLSPAPAEFAAEAVLTAYTLMACGRGRGRCLQRHHPMEPPVAGPATVGRQAAEAEIAGFGRGGPGGVAGPRLAAPQFPTRWPGVRPHATGRQDSGAVLRKLGDGHCV